MAAILYAKKVALHYIKIDLNVLTPKLYSLSPDTHPHNLIPMVFLTIPDRRHATLRSRHVRRPLHPRGLRKLLGAF